MMLSIDGYAVGPNQRLEEPFGDYTDGLRDWVFKTKTGAEMIGAPGGDEGIDNDFLAAATDGIGATIIGRNMFTPSRGPWIDDGWTGWWGPNPPYHNDVFVLTNHPRQPLAMDGGTIFHFVTTGVVSALALAYDAANGAEGAEGADVRLVGGPSTVRQYLQAGLIDEMHLAVAPMLIGAGERVFDGLEPPVGYKCIEHTSTAAVTHFRFERR